MTPQITCLALNNRSSLCIILGSTSAPIIIVIVRIVVILPYVIIPIPSGCGTCAIRISATARRGSLLCEKHLRRSSCLHVKGALFCRMAHDLTNVTELVLWTRSFSMTVGLTLRAPQFTAFWLLLHVFKLLHHADHVLLEGTNLLTVAFLVAAITSDRLVVIRIK